MLETYPERGFEEMTGEHDSGDVYLGRFATDVPGAVGLSRRGDVSWPARTPQFMRVLWGYLVDTVFERRLRTRLWMTRRSGTAGEMSAIPSGYNFQIKTGFA